MSDTTMPESGPGAENERPSRPGHRADNERPARPGGRNERRPAPPLVKLMALDRDILHLVSRRARLLKAAYAGYQPEPPADDAQGEKQAPPRPAKSKRPGSRPSERTRVEKALREAWQAEAAKISPDQRLSRQLFALLQDISVPDGGAPSRPKGEGFALTPPRQPVDVDLPGFVSRAETAFCLALAAATGADCRVDNAALNDRAIDLVKTFNQAGAHLSWEPDNAFISRGGALNYSDAVIFTGNEPLGLYLSVFFAVPQLSKIKFMGGPDLKALDLTPLRQFLPQLGARLAPVVPGAKGLPVRLECSGMLPETLTIPENLPAGALQSLIIAAAVWQRAITLDCSAHPEAALCFAATLPLLANCGARVSEANGIARFEAAALRVPASPVLGLDMFLTSFFLALPALSGGGAHISGRWDSHLADEGGWSALLRSAGLEFSRTDSGVRVRASSAAGAEIAASAGEGLPLALALAVGRALSKGECRLRLRAGACWSTNATGDASGDTATGAAGAMPGALADAALAEDFAQQSGCSFTLEDDGVALVRREADPEAPRPWAAPSAAWAFALALTACARPGLLLANPGSVAELLPIFWPMYNSLPKPQMPRPAQPEPEAEPEAPRRRRVIVGKVE